MARLRSTAVFVNRFTETTAWACHAHKLKTNRAVDTRPYGLGLNSIAGYVTALKLVAVILRPDSSCRCKYVWKSLKLRDLVL